MRIVMFYHSLVSDWNHGNAHFLRGIATELLNRGNDVEIFEPREGWSASNLWREHGAAAFNKFHKSYPLLDSKTHTGFDKRIEQSLERANLVIVHEWNDPNLVSEIGAHHLRHGGYRLFFHDTHHRMVTEPDMTAKYDLNGYDGVLAYGAVLQELYNENGYRAWTWHEAADTRVFHPRPNRGFQGDLVWVGNWGDDERAAELREFLIEPCKRLGLKASVYGVRYPEEAKRALNDAGIEYRGWLPNFDVPEVFARFKLTVHIPRRPYVKALPGIPTIRPFEALACGIPLVCSPWRDVEHLFSPAKDFLIAENGDEMTNLLQTVLEDPVRAKTLASNGLIAIRSRHTCAHRVDQLFDICRVNTSICHEAVTL
jgi:spore maturation protein CgeB